MKKEYEVQSLLTGLSSPGIIVCRKGDSISAEFDRISVVRGVVVKILDGNFTKDAKSCYAQICAVFDFPIYFGNNLNALLDAMEDERLKGGEPLLLRVTNADKFLSDEPCPVLHGFISTFLTISERWRIAIDDGESWDAPERRFSVILEYE